MQLYRKGLQSSRSPYHHDPNPDLNYTRGGGIVYALAVVLLITTTLTLTQILTLTLIPASASEEARASITERL